jgi:NAD(P)-dependent dehydrogenase (short-subunit alcohol dehydrogenase family)
MKRAIVTGGTRGIGQGIAQALADRRWEVTIVGRDPARGRRVAQEMGASFICADLVSMRQVRELAASVTGPIDALVLSAGAVFPDGQPVVTSEGLERGFALNCVSRFVLAEALAPQFAPGGCLVMTGGYGKRKGMDADWGTRTGIPGAMQAALGVDLFAIEFARRHPEIRVHTCYPGAVRSQLLERVSAPLHLYLKVFGRAPARAARGFVRLIEEPTSTVHWDGDKPMRFSPPLPDASVSSALWETLARMGERAS